MTYAAKKSRLVCPKTTREIIASKLVNTKCYGIRAHILLSRSKFELYKKDSTKILIIMKESSKDIKKCKTKRRTSWQKLLDDLDKKK